VAARGRGSRGAGHRSSVWDAIGVAAPSWGGSGMARRVGVRAVRGGARMKQGLGAGLCRGQGLAGAVLGFGSWAPWRLVLQRESRGGGAEGGGCSGRRREAPAGGARARVREGREGRSVGP
jgi:hypothetical protein